MIVGISGAKGIINSQRLIDELLRDLKASQAAKAEGEA
jgi:3-polyprenyl-4-hydroxybenzoate decarboxylase